MGYPSSSRGGRDCALVLNDSVALVFFLFGFLVFLWGRR